MNPQEANKPARTRRFSLTIQSGCLILTFAFLFCLTACTPVNTPAATSTPDYSLGSPVAALDNQGANPSIVIFGGLAILAVVIAWAISAYPKTQQEQKQIANAIGGEQVSGTLGIKFQKRVKDGLFLLREIHAIQPSGFAI